MNYHDNIHILRALDIARQLTALADKVDGSCDDEGCIVMSGVIRDCAYTIRNRAEREREARKLRGLWNAGTRKSKVATRKG